MVITYKTLGHIAFPAFPLPSSNWEEQDGLLYLDNKLLDDKNMKGKTLGRRRPVSYTHLTLPTILLV